MNKPVGKNLTMLHDRVLVLPHPEEEVTSGGIFIPDNAKQKPTKGTILSVGSPADMELETKVGDVVLYGKYSGQSIDCEEGECKIMKESEIFAIETRAEHE